MKKILLRCVAMILVVTTMTISLTSCDLLEWVNNMDSTQSEQSQTEDSNDENNSELEDSKNDNNCELGIHNWQFNKTLEETTCTTDGIVEYSCVCGENKIELQKSSGHSFGEWNTEIEPTCNNTGMMSHSCIDCSYAEKKILDSSNHTYVVKEKTVHGVTDKIFKCSNCENSFSVNASLLGEDFSLNSQHLFDCEKDFSFEIISYGDEEYIRDNLCIIDEYYVGSENENSETSICGYTLEKIANTLWKVSPISNYVEGVTYIAKRTGDVVFKDYGVQDLRFSIQKEETNVIELNDEIIFLQTLENNNPGYYPYSIEVSEATSTYWLKLGKIDGLNISDIVCIGNSCNFNDILENPQNNYFGEILSFTKIESENSYLVQLCQPSVKELFNKLEIYTSKISNAEEIEVDENVEEQITAALYSSDDFAKLLSVTYTSASAYLSERGLNTTFSNFKEFLSSIKIAEEDTEYFHYDDEKIKGKITIKGNSSIPVTLSNNSESQNLGNVNVSFSAYVELEFKPNMQFENSKYTKFDFRVDQDIKVGLSFKVQTNIDYTAENKPYVWNMESGVYHFNNCKHISQIKNSTKIQSISTIELFQKIENDNLNTIECQTCKPIAAMTSSLYIINNTSKVFHTCYCVSAKNIASINLIFSERSAENLISNHYSPCENCHPEQTLHNGFEERMLDKIKYEDFGEYIDEVKDFANSMQSGSASNDIFVGSVSFNIYGVATIKTSFHIYLEFRLDASLNYEFELQNKTYYGVKTKNWGLMPYGDDTGGQTICNKNLLSLSGKTRFDVGLRTALDLSILGDENLALASANMSLKTGVYAKLNGTLQLDFNESQSNYSAAYFESGFHCDVEISAELVEFDVLKPTTIYDDDFPFARLGYEKVYYNFSNIPSSLEIDSLYTNLSNKGLLDVRCYNLVDMTSKTETLDVFGNPGHYTIELTLGNGTNCYIQNGYLIVNSNIDEFSDILTVRVLGCDTWDNYLAGKCKVLLPEYTITINYKIKQSEIDSNKLEYQLSEDGTYYVVVGIGEYQDSHLVIPEKLNNVPVTFIGAFAFKDCKSITNVTLHNNISIIGESAFEGCTNLVNIDFGNNSKLQTIGNNAFAHCVNLTIISIPSFVNFIGEYALYNCQSLYMINVNIANPAYKSIQGNLYTIDGKTLIQYAIGNPSEEFSIPYGVGIPNLHPLKNNGVL